MLATSTQLQTQEPLLSLIGSAPFSFSCSQEVHQEQSQRTFDWSDLPVLGDASIISSSTCDFERRPSVLESSPFLSTSSSDHHFDLSSLRRRRSVPPPPPPASSPCSVTQDLSSTPTRKTHKKKVSFSEVLEIRTHEIELGDHPCCTGGMALQCGWSHSEPELVDMEIHERHSTKRRNAGLRLGYAQRRQRLQEVTGLSGSDLLKLEYQLACDGTETNILHHTPSLKSLASAAVKSWASASV